MTDQELSRDRSRSEPTELITAVTSDSDEDNSNEGRDLFSDTDESDTDDSIPPLRRIEEKASRFSAGMNPTLPFTLHQSMAQRDIPR